MSDSRRSVNTKIWHDEWVEKLNPIEKLIWIYLLTNSSTNIAGIYELSDKRIEFDTGVSRDEVAGAMRRFASDGKISHLGSWIIMWNWRKNQSMNESMTKGAEKIIDSLPEHVRKLYQCPPTLPPPCTQAVHSVIPPSPHPVPTLPPPGGEIEKEIEKEIEIEIKTPKPPKGDEGVEIPESLKTIPGFIEAWEKWVPFRKKMKACKDFKTMFQEQLAKMEKHPEMAVAVIEKSIMNGYQGLIFDSPCNTRLKYDAVAATRPPQHYESDKDTAKIWMEANERNIKAGRF